MFAETDDCRLPSSIRASRKRPLQIPGNILLGAASFVNDNFLFGIVECDSAAGLYGGDGHAERHGMAIASFDVGIWRFTVAHTLHPIADVCGSVNVATGVSSRCNVTC